MKKDNTKQESPYDSRYTLFKIPKKSGGFREILAPDEELKLRQRQILNKLYETTTPPMFCKGFIQGVSIVDNAKIHKNQKYILNIDIKDFFTNCKRKNLPSDIEKVLTKEEIEMLFYKDYLPQGAPTSPYVANFYLKEADNLIFYLLRLHISDDIIYTRYADDLTISSNSKAIFSDTCMQIIKNVLKQYGFQINNKKIAKMKNGRRMEVTGLCLNSGVPTVSRKKRNIIRAAVHNILTGKRTNPEDIKRTKGWLAFLASVPAHRKWALEQMEKINQALSQSLTLTTVGENK